MKINCDKAGQLLERGEYDRIGFWERRRLRLHMKMCQCCADYERDNKILSKIIKMAGIEFTKDCISKEEKSRMKAHLDNIQD